MYVLSIYESYEFIEANCILYIHLDIIMLLLFLMLNIFEGKLYVIKFNTVICNYSIFIISY